MEIDNFLSKFGIKHDDLRREERETLTKWLSGIAQKKISVEDIGKYVRTMADGVAREMSDETIPRKKDIFLSSGVFLKWGQ